MGLFDSFDYNPTPGGSMLMGLGAGLLQASVPSLMPQGIGQGLGRGMMYGQQMAHEVRRDQMYDQAQKRQDLLAEMTYKLKERELAQKEALDAYLLGQMGGGVVPQSAPMAPQSAPAVPQSAPQLPYGPVVHNNNPGNLRPASGKGFQVFPTLQDGANAMSGTLERYGTKHGINTLLGLTSRYAPKGDGANDPVAYANYLSKQIGGYPIDAPIDLTNPEFRARLMVSMSALEKGQPNALPLEVAQRAVAPRQYAQAGQPTASDASGPPPGVGVPGQPSPEQLALWARLSAFTDHPIGKMAKGQLDAYKAVREAQTFETPEQKRKAELAQAAATKRQDQNISKENPTLSAGVEIIGALAPKIADGTATPDEERRYGLAFQKEFGEVRTMPDGSSARIPPPPDLPTPRGWQQKLPGGDKPLTPADAGKIQGAKLSTQYLSDVMFSLFDGNGELNRTALFKSLIPGAPEQGIRQKIRESIGYALYLKTGAAATPKEIAEQEGLYMPALTDNSTVARDKIKRLGDFLDSVVAGTGKENAPTATAGKSAPKEEPGTVDLKAKYGLE